MKTVNKFAGVLSIIAGVLFILSALIGKNYIFIPIGFCFIVLGIVFGKNDGKNKSANKEENDK